MQHKIAVSKSNQTAAKRNNFRKKQCKQLHTGVGGKKAGSDRKKQSGFV